MHVTVLRDQQNPDMCSSNHILAQFSQWCKLDKWEQAPCYTDHLVTAKEQE